jgi:adenylate cyclase
VLLEQGDTAGAIAEFQKGKLLDPDPMYDVYLGCSYVAAGDRAKAEQVLHDLEDRAKQRYISPGVRVRLLLKLGEKVKALDWLEKCYEEQDGACWWLKCDPLYDSVRNELRFQALLKKVGLDK